MKDDLELIKNNGLTQKEIDQLREKFLNEYAKNKGWNPKELSTNQMLEIVSTKGYKTAGLILG
jgi:Ca2+-binding EF-hand superfamily protein